MATATASIIISDDYLADCSRSVPAWISPDSTVMLRNRSTGVFSRHSRQADGRTIDAIGTVIERVISQAQATPKTEWVRGSMAG